MISVIHPTARVTGAFQFPWWEAAESVLYNRCIKEDFEYILVVHASRILEFRGCYGYPPLRGACRRFVVVTNERKDNLVDQCNAGLQAASGDIICWQQDDMRYPENWDAEVLRLIPDPRELVCIQARTDGGRRDLLTLPTIATRALHRAIGLIPSEYDGMFSDDEWSIKAAKLGKVIQSPIYFEHRHYTLGKSEKDEVYERENSEEAYKLGWRVFQERKAQGFPRVPFDDEKEGDTSPLPAPAALPILAMCIPGKTFSGEWLDSFLALGAELRDEGYLVKRFRAYYSNAYQTRIELASRVIEDAKISGDRPKYVLWLDDDNCALPQQLRGLIQFLDYYPAVDAVSGWCWIRKAHGWATSAGLFSEDTGVHLANFNLDALFAGETSGEKFAPKSCEQTGFPFLLMRYEALEKLGPYAFRPLTKADLPAYFESQTAPAEVADHWFCGEDSAWCLQAKKAGLVLVVDPGCKVAHLKLQPVEPDIGKITPETPEELKAFREGVNGPPVSAPVEYERVIS